MKRVWSWLAILVLAFSTYLLFPETCKTFYSMIEHGDIAALAAYIQGLGFGGVAVTLFLFVIMTFTIVFPFMILSGAAGIVYGLFWGVMISWAGEVIGAIVMFVFARYFFRHMIEGWIEKSKYLKQVDDYSAKNGFHALLIARLLPLAPSGIITAVAAISKMSFRDFMLATVLGKLPPVVIKVLLGHDLAFAGENMTRLIVVVLLVVVIYAGMWWYKRQRRLSEEV